MPLSARIAMLFHKIGITLTRETSGLEQLMKTMKPQVYQFVAKISTQVLSNTEQIVIHYAAVSGVKWYLHHMGTF